MNNKPLILKLTIVGDSGVGKTSIMHRYIRRNFSSYYVGTIGADFHTKEIVIDNKKINLQIWDTAGQERFDALGKAFYRGTDCCILVYDITNEKSFTQLSHWKNDVLTQIGLSLDEPFPFLVVGNKIDLTDKCFITSNIGKEWCDNENIQFIEASAKDGKNIDELFDIIARKGLEYYKEPIITPHGFLHEKEETEWNYCYC